MSALTIQLDLSAKHKIVSLAQTDKKLSATHKIVSLAQTDKIWEFNLLLHLATAGGLSDLKRQ